VKPPRLVEWGAGRALILPLYPDICLTTKENQGKPQSGNPKGARLNSAERDSFSRLCQLWRWSRLACWPLPPLAFTSGDGVNSLPVPILSQLDPVHNSTFNSLWYNLTLSSHLRLGLPGGLFPSGYPTKTLYTPLLSPYALHTQPILFSFLPPEFQWRMTSELCVVFKEARL
jgi:hypothetical protein